MSNNTSNQRSSLRQPAVIAWLRLARIYHKVDAASARLFKEFGLSTAQFDVLAQIGAAEGLSQQDLAAALLVTKGNISQILERMEHDGIVSRQQEGRTKLLFLTVRGRELYRQAVGRQEAHIAALFATLGHDDQLALARMLRQLDHTLD
jgi:DNA-binding MarR family transcriptional regulator